MAVYTFVCRLSGGTWTAKQTAGDEGLESSASSPYELRQKLSSLALATAGSGGLSSSFSLITPSTAVAQVIVGGGGGGGGGFAASAGPAAGGASSAPAAAEKEPEKPAEKEEESDDDMGFSLFD